jgi:EPS-associated MarR family transcriptional regulator
VCSSRERCAIICRVIDKTFVEMRMRFSDEEVMKALRVLEKHPELSQRRLAKELSMSLGKTHYILNALIDVGLVKVDNFKRSDNKLGYAYLLTPRGFIEKAKVTKKFLMRKQREYKELECQISELTSELESMNSGVGK